MRGKHRDRAAFLGHYARGYRSPSWDLSPHSVDLFLQHGFTYDSSMMGDDYTPYYARQGDVIELEWLAQLGPRQRARRDADQLVPPRTTRRISSTCAPRQRDPAGADEHRPRAPDAGSTTSSTWAAKR